MKQEDIEMPEDYKERLAQLTEMLEAREELVKHAGEVPADERAHYNSQLRKLDKTIDEMETMLAKERDRIELVRAKEADLSAKIGRVGSAKADLYSHQIRVARQACRFYRESPRAAAGRCSRGIPR